MLHKFPPIEFPEGERSLEQTCLTCGIRSIVYKPRARFYYNARGIKTTNAPRCLKVDPQHNFPKVEIPDGEKEIIQTCMDCGKQRVAYASKWFAYFDEATGARIPYITTCTPLKDAKVVSITDFVRTNQVDCGAIEIMGKFIEAIFILKSVEEDGEVLSERVRDMVKTFMAAQEYPIDQPKSVALG